MKVEEGKTYQVRRQFYRVLKIEGGKVHAKIGDYVLPYDIDQFERMITRK